MAIADAGVDTGAAPASHRSYLRYANGRFLFASLALCLACLLAYAIHDPPQGRSGGTWLGYTLGSLGAALMLWLAWYGVRKRKYSTGSGKARAWLSAHVYFGPAALFIVTLHTGFHLGANLHALAYLLFWGVALSGAYGVWAYWRLPSRISANRQGTPPEAMVEEIASLEETALRLADRVDDETHQVVVRSVARLKIGGGLWEQVTGRYKKAGDATAAVRDLLKKKAAGAPKKAAAPPKTDPQGRPMLRRGGDDEADSTVMYMADQLFESGRGAKPKPEPEEKQEIMKTDVFMAQRLMKEGGEVRSENLKKILEALGRRRELVERLNRDITLRARMNVWLYLHVPLTVALVTAVVAHVLSVFLYR